MLFHALARLKQHPWRLFCAGSERLHPPTAALLRNLATELDLTKRIEFLGELDAAALATRYRRADAFVLPSHHEGYGMALAEALARDCRSSAPRRVRFPTRYRRMRGCW